MKLTSTNMHEIYDKKSIFSGASPPHSITYNGSLPRQHYKTFSEIHGHNAPQKDV